MIYSYLIIFTVLHFFVCLTGFNVILINKLYFCSYRELFKPKIDVSIKQDLQVTGLFLGNCDNLFFDVIICIYILIRL